MDENDLRLGLLRLSRVLHVPGMDRLRLESLPALQAEVAALVDGASTAGIRVQPPTMGRAFAYWFDGEVHEPAVLGIGLSTLGPVLDELDRMLRPGSTPRVVAQAKAEAKRPAQYGLL